MANDEQIKQNDFNIGRGVVGGQYLQMEGMNSVTGNVFYNICTGGAI